MYDTDRYGTRFKVYLTRHELRQKAVEAALRLGLDQESAQDETFIFIEMPGKTTQEAVQHFRDTRDANDRTINGSMLLVFDSADLRERGALLISLYEYHGYDDAIRLAPADATMAICALNVGNDNWYSHRHGVPHERTARMPVEWFALYDLLSTTTDAAAFASVLVSMGQGVMLVGTDTEEQELDPTPVENIFCGVRPEVDNGAHCSLADLEQRHAAFATRSFLDNDYYAVIDKDYQEQGVLIVRLWPRVESFRCRLPVAGELLRWIFINFMTWDDAKSYAAGSK
ncbi:hypothetical protein CDD82_2501 [Ophiocordyceps australis]|uniref:Uncharacterized protein n=1 Tax=Ophiocordyceps australis TaxID=1399860 RepID=A0A2C5ZE40_9HYPO|nr:hypothetical protein CDD82_2501 [Ophiocordyceps australis]